MFRYIALDGRPLVGWLILPPDYQEGQRYPMITWVYGGLTYSAERPPTSIAAKDPTNVQLFAAHGYVVLLPSMPLEPFGRASDPLLDLTNGVLPAVNKAVELGIADSPRVGVYGLSYGGYSVMALIGQTNRFRAAVSHAGFADLISFYGTLDARLRYDRDPLQYLSSATIESGQLRMAARRGRM